MQYLYNFHTLFHTFVLKVTRSLFSKVKELTFYCLENSLSSMPGQKRNVLMAKNMHLFEAYVKEDI